MVGAVTLPSAREGWGPAKLAFLLLALCAWESKGAVLGSRLPSLGEGAGRM